MNYEFAKNNFNTSLLNRNNDKKYLETSPPKIVNTAAITLTIVSIFQIELFI